MSVFTHYDLCIVSEALSGSYQYVKEQSTRCMVIIKPVHKTQGTGRLKVEQTKPVADCSKEQVCLASLF